MDRAVGCVDTVLVVVAQQGLRGDSQGNNPCEASAKHDPIAVSRCALLTMTDKTMNKPNYTHHDSPSSPSFAASILQHIPESRVVIRQLCNLVARHAPQTIPVEVLVAVRVDVLFGSGRLAIQGVAALVFFAKLVPHQRRGKDVAEGKGDGGGVSGHVARGVVVAVGLGGDDTSCVAC